MRRQLTRVVDTRAARAVRAMQATNIRGIVWRVPVVWGGGGTLMQLLKQAVETEGVSEEYERRVAEAYRGRYSATWCGMVADLGRKWWLVRTRRAVRILVRGYTHSPLVAGPCVHEDTNDAAWGWAWGLR
jgi:hypothetical protein